MPINAWKKIVQHLYPLGKSKSNTEIPSHSSQNAYDQENK
jgi:hypothetical protein